MLVQQISKIDKSAGYDIASFRGVGKNPDSKILIEVKGTRESNLRFIWSYNERRVAAAEKHRYWIWNDVITTVSTNLSWFILVIRNLVIASRRFPKDCLDLYSNSYNRGDA